MRPSLAIWFLVPLGIAVLWGIMFKPNSGRPPRPIPAVADLYGHINSSLGQYEVDNGTYPKSLQDLVRQPSGATNWHGPYLEPPKWPVDPWGNPYIYHFPGKHNLGSYDLSSAGPDGKEGTSDDIVNWSK